MTQDEAEELLRLLKELHDRCLYIPEPSKTLEYECATISKKSKFIISVYRAGRNAKKCTFQARTKGMNDVILRLDVNPSPHRNPDNKIIHGSHLHIYRDGYGTSYAFPFDVNDDDLVSNFIQFLDEFNVIQKDITITQQVTLFS